MTRYLVAGTMTVSCFLEVEAGDAEQACELAASAPDESWNIQTGRQTAGLRGSGNTNGEHTMTTILPESWRQRIEEHPSIGTLVPQYVAYPVNFPKWKAVRVIINDQLSSHNARGKGRNAKRRIDEIFAAKERAWHEAQIYTAGYEDGLRDGRRHNPKPNFGVLHPTATESRTFLHVDSSGQHLEEF